MGPHLWESPESTRLLPPMAGNSTQRAFAQPKPSGRCVLSAQERGEHHFPAKSEPRLSKQPAESHQLEPQGPLDTRYPWDPKEGLQEHLKRRLIASLWTACEPLF